jgi:hypothetical protein
MLSAVGAGRIALVDPESLRFVSSTMPDNRHATSANTINSTLNMKHVCRENSIRRRLLRGKSITTQARPHHPTIQRMTPIIR